MLTEGLAQRTTSEERIFNPIRPPGPATTIQPRSRRRVSRFSSPMTRTGSAHSRTTTAGTKPPTTLAGCSSRSTATEVSRTIATMIYAGSEPVAVYSRTITLQNTWSYLLSDRQSSVATITNSSGAPNVRHGSGCGRSARQRRGVVATRTQADHETPSNSIGKSFESYFFWLGRGRVLLTPKL
jgi:hypothetical protein